jgi:hypothetical protein
MAGEEELFPSMPRVRLGRWWPDTSRAAESGGGRDDELLEGYLVVEGHLPVDEVSPAKPTP